MNWRKQSGGREAAFAVVAVAAYLGGAVWAKEVSLPGPVLVWFPPAGIAVACLYLRPRLLPALVLAEMFSTREIMGLGHEFGVLPLVVNAVCIVGAYGLAGYALRRLHLDPRQRSSDDLVILAFGCLVVGASAAALLGVLVQVWVGLGTWKEFTRSVGLFWVGDVVAMACLTPWMVMGGAAYLDGRPLPLADYERATPRWLLLSEYLLPSVAAVGLMSLGDTPMRFTYLAFIPVVGLAIRHGVAAAALSSAALGAVLSAGAHVLVDDPLVRSDVQLLMMMLTLTGIMIGAVVSARRDVLDAKNRISQIIEATPDLVATAGPDGKIRYLNPAGRALLGVAAEDVSGAQAFDFMPDELAVGLMREGMRSAERFGTWTGENRLRRADGQILPISQVLIAHRQPGDEVVTFSTVGRDMSDQRELEDQLRRAALYDDTTGLPNRALLSDQLNRLVDASEPGRHGAVLFADVDHLERVNEAFGFSTGDQIITAIAHRLPDLVRGADLVARYGGAQFVVVLPDISDEFDAILFAERLLACFADPVTIAGRSVKVTGSVGIALTATGQGHQEALRSAEIALHRAKEAGGGRLAMFDQSLEHAARKRMEVEADLREVLATGSWWLAYQPIVDAETRRIISAEALLRWTHPTRGPVAPYELVRLAEHSGAIVDLGREIFSRACEEAVQWHREGFDLRVSINVSALQLRDPHFVDDVTTVIRETGIPAEQVAIELTETMLATDEHGEIATLRRLREFGCKVALDDFGTGWSSLSGLRDLPIDMVKLDQSFITPLTTSPRAAALVEAMVHLGEGLGLDVVAEGVETEEQFASLKKLGCHSIQGYVVSRPVGPDDFTKLLVRGREDARRSV